MASSPEKRPDVTDESVQAQILSRLSALEARLDSLQHAFDNDVKLLSSCHQVAGGTVTPIVREFRNIHARLATVELNGSVNINTSDATSILTTPVDVTRHDDRFTATIEALQLQLVQVKQDTAQLNKKSLKAYQQFQQQVQAITCNNKHMLLQHKLEMQDFIDTMQSSSLSRFQQLELLLNSNCMSFAADYEQYKAIVDTLAGNSVNLDKFCQLETTISSLTHRLTASHQKVLQSTEQQCTVIKHLITQLEDLDTQHKQLQTFIDDCTQVSDPALRRILGLQQFIVKTMQREVDLYRQDIRARMTSEIDLLKQTLADVAINTILARVTSVQLTRTITMKQLVDPIRNTNIMSVSNSGDLLVGSRGWSELHIYDPEGRHVSSVNKLLKFKLHLQDAIWTPQGNIVCTSRFDDKVMTMTRSGDVIATKHLVHVSRLSVSADNVIYVACAIVPIGVVYQSTDDGMTWNHAFTCSDANGTQAIKVFSDTNIDIFYVLDLVVGADWRLREYTMNNRQSNDHATGYDVALFYDTGFISVAFDGRTKVFATQPKADKTLRVFSVGQRTESTLDLSEYLSEDIHHVTVDSHRNELYVSLRVPGTVNVFKLPKA